MRKRQTKGHINLGEKVVITMGVGTGDTGFVHTVHDDDTDFVTVKTKDGLLVKSIYWIEKEEGK